MRSPPAHGRAPLGRGAAVLALCIAACATPGGLLARLDLLTAKGEFDQAVALVDGAKESNYGAKNALLFELDRGMLLHLAGKASESNQAFEKAKALSKALYTKSVTTEAGALLTSDNLRPYAGENFERAQIPLFCALNYLMVGNGSDALVETRQVDGVLAKLKTDLGHKDVYTEDAFARYLAGLIQEDQGELNDAAISYRQALKAYDTYAREYGLAAPRELVRDALRATTKLGFHDQAEELKKRWGAEPPAPRPKSAGEVVVVHYQGLPPRKVDTFFEIDVAKGWVYVDAQRPVGEDARQVEQARALMRSVVADQQVRVAFPSFEPTPYEVRGLSVKADGAAEEHAAETAQDIGAIAAKNLKDRIGRERAKAIARAVIKWTLTQKAADKAKEKQGGAAGWLVKTALQLVSTATEVSDKRSWGTLPDKIALARVTLPEGEHALRITFRTAAGAAAGTKDLEGVKVKAGRRTFVVVRTAQ